MRLHLLLPLGGTYGGGDPRTIIDLARRAEDAGADGVVLAEHIVMGEDVGEYGWGAFPLRPSDPFPEPVVLMSAISMVTERLTLGTGILIAALRPAALLAKQLATLDQLCSGRLELGVGTGWHQAELEAHGLDHARRGQLLTDTVTACRALWGPQPATVATPSFSFGPVFCEPQPTRQGGPPVLFSGTLNQRNIDRVLKLGDGWIPIMGQDQESIHEGIVTLRRAFAEAGRDPEHLRVRIPLPLIKNAGRLSLTQTLAGATTTKWPGVTDCTVPVSAFIRTADDVKPFFEELSDARG